MRIHVAHDRNGRILGAAVEGGDQPVATPGLSVTELDVPAEFEQADPAEFLHQMSVDVQARKLVRRG